MIKGLMALITAMFMMPFAFAQDNVNNWKPSQYLTKDELSLLLTTRDITEENREVISKSADIFLNETKAWLISANQAGWIDNSLKEIEEINMDDIALVKKVKYIGTVYKALGQTFVSLFANLKEKKIDLDKIATGTPLDISYPENDNLLRNNRSEEKTLFAHFHSLIKEKVEKIADYLVAESEGAEINDRRIFDFEIAVGSGEF